MKTIAYSTNRLSWVAGIVIALCPVAFLKAEGQLIHSDVLGNPPLCEASGATWFPAQPDLVAVVDNEVHDRIFLFQTVDERLVFVGELPLPAQHRPRDLEAIAIDGEQLVLVGSHSENSRGEYKEKRHRIRWLAMDDSWGLHERQYRDRGAIDRTAGSHLDLCIDGYFSGRRDVRHVAFCEALVGDQGGGGVNIEGAVMTEVDGRREFWLGLREPIIEEGAFILRHSMDAGLHSAVSVSVIDLEGEGIREMVQGSGGLWLISGPVDDAEQSFSLWFIPSDQVGEVIQPQRIYSDLPSGSEGLVVGNERAWVMIDGEEGEDESSCARPSRYIAIELPAM